MVPNNLLHLLLEVWQEDFSLFFEILFLGLLSFKLEGSDDLFEGVEPHELDSALLIDQLFLDGRNALRPQIVLELYLADVVKDVLQFRPTKIS